MTCSYATAEGFENCAAPALGLKSYGAIGDGTLNSWIATAIAQSKPSGAPSTYAAACEASLRARGILYYKSTPGDCGAPSQIPGISSAQIVGLSGSAAGGLASGLGAAGIIGGAATLGITSAISVGVAAIEGIFAHHAAAVKDEQSTICAVMNYFNPLLQGIDAAVASGQISTDQANTYLQQVVLTAKNGLAGIMKICDAACVYQAILQAHVYFARNYYPSIAPVSIYPQNPGSAPDNIGTPPGGVTVVGNNPIPAPPVRSTAANTYAPAIPGNAPMLTAPNSLASTSPGAPDYLNMGYNQNTGQSAQVTDVPSTSINWGMIAAVVGIIALLVSVL